MKSSMKTQLSIMMFLEFFIWGGWFVTMGTFLSNSLNASGGELGQAYGTQSWGAIIAPFIIGLIADRFFNAERILGVLHLVGAILMYQLSKTSDFGVFYPYLLGYMILYMPTLALVNSVAFNHMKDPTKEFSLIRVWVLGLFSFALPKTPPQAKGEKTSISDILGLEALALLKDWNFLIFFISSILICIPLAFYYQHANQFLTEINVANATAKMTIGQISEVLFMLLLPWFFTKFGFKKTLLVGMIAWVLRYVLFAYGNAGELSFMLILGIALHGICYDFFFVSGQIYTDSKAGEKVKSAAQGLITLATYGLGMLIGFWIAGKITDANLFSEGVHSWGKIWMYPAYFALGVSVLYFIFFKDEKIEYAK